MQNLELVNLKCVTYAKPIPLSLSSSVLTLHSPFYLFIRKKYSNWMAILSTLESTTLDETIRCASKWLSLTLKNAKFRVGESQVCNLRKTHSSVLKFLCPHITFAILPFYQKKIFKLNGHPEYFGIYYSWWNHQMCFKMVKFNFKKCKI